MRNPSIVALVMSLLLLPSRPAAAHLVSGILPEPPIHAAGGGLVLLDLRVDPNGSVIQERELRSDPPFGQSLADAVQGWLFDFADASDHALVAGLFHPFGLFDFATPEPAPEPPGTPPEIHYPLVVVAAPFPPRAVMGGVVLMLVGVDDQGSVSSVSIERSAAGLDDAAAMAVRLWKFRPARRDGRDVASHAFVLFGFGSPDTPAKK
jgi:TonB family protein